MAPIREIVVVLSNNALPGASIHAGQQWIAEQHVPKQDHDDQLGTSPLAWCRSF